MALRLSVGDSGPLVLREIAVVTAVAVVYGICIVALKWFGAFAGVW